MARFGRWNLDDRLLRFNCKQRLIDHDVIAFSDIPSDDFRLAQALAKVGELERAH